MTDDKPADWGEWVEDYHHCAGEYACDVGGGGICSWIVGFEKVFEARNAGRVSRPKPPPRKRIVIVADDNGEWPGWAFDAVLNNNNVRGLLDELADGEKPRESYEG